MNLKPFVVEFSLTYWLLAVLFVEGIGVFVLKPNCPDVSLHGSLCAIDDLLEATESDTILELNSRDYFLTQSHLLVGLSNVAIISRVGSSSLICKNDSGIAFVNQENLTIVSISIQNCSLNARLFQTAVELVKATVSVWFFIPPTSRVAIFIGHAYDVNLTNVTVTGTKGVGILSINVMGNSTLSSVMLSKNIRTSCEESLSNSAEVIGGGAYFYYFDFYHNNLSLASTEAFLEISDSKFISNADCSSVAQDYLDNKFSTCQHTIGGGGGLSIIYGHSSYSVLTIVSNCSFEGNDAKYGGGAHVAVFSRFSLPNAIIFDGCMFVCNGYAARNLDIEPTSCGGAGLAVFSDLFKPSTLIEELTLGNLQVSIQNTLFDGNIAQIEGGGLYMYSDGNSPHGVIDVNMLSHQIILWQLKNVTLVSNAAQVISSASFSQRSFSGFDGTALLILNSVTLQKGFSRSDDTRLPGREVYSSMSIQNIITTWKGSSLLEGNKVTALSVVSSTLICLANSEVIFRQNQGYRGGAVFMKGYAPTFVIESNVSIVFSENKASVEGGAVYYSSSYVRKKMLEQDHFFGCFISNQMLQFQDFFSSDNNIVFERNKSPLGSSVFGGALEFCPWLQNVTGTENLFQELNSRNSTFQFSTSPIGKSQVSSYAASINVTASSVVLPGELVPLNILVFDYYRNEIFSVVTTDQDPRYIFNPHLSDFGYWFTAQGNPTLQIFGPQNTSSVVSYVTNVNDVVQTLEVSLQACPAGFEFVEERKACICSHLVLDLAPNAICDNQTLTITVENGFWLGKDLEYVNTTYTSNLIFHTCYSGFCKGGTFRPPNYDVQCGNDSMRTGVLCGACKDGYTISFSTLSCRKCSNYYGFLVLLLIFLGLVVFVIVAFLGFTVDKGWMYAVFYYSNFVILYSYDTMPLYAPVSHLFWPISSFSLVSSFDLCYFDGMNVVHRAYFDIFIPIYLYCLILIFALLARKFPLSAYFSPANTFVTINIISYVDLLVDCISIFSGNTVTTLGGQSSTRWLEDPNIRYFTKGHIGIGLIAIIILITLIIGFPVLLLFPKCLYKYKIFKSGKPFYDALYAPYESNLRFWLGIRIIALEITSLMAQLFRADISMFISILILSVLVQIQITIKPYKNYKLNILDSFFILMVLFLLVGASSPLNSELVSLALRVIYSLVAVIPPLLLIVVVMLHHLDLRFPIIKEKILIAIHKIIRYVRGKASRSGEVARPQCPTTSEIVISRGPYEPVPVVFTNSQYRESIIEEDSL